MTLEFQSEQRAREVAINLVASGYRIMFFTKEVDNWPRFNTTFYVIEVYDKKKEE